MTPCRSWPLYGLLALALVVRAGWADDQPAKETKATDCCKAKQVKQCAEKCGFEELVRQIVSLGQMCNPSCEDDADCPKFPDFSPKNSISLSIGLSSLGGVPALIPSIDIECNKACPKSVCKPCDEVDENTPQFCVQTKVMHDDGRKPSTLCCPRLTVSAGQPAFVCIGQNAPCTPGCSMEVKVTEATPESAHLEMEVSQTPDAVDTKDRFVRLNVSRMAVVVPLGKTVMLPLRADSNGAKWKSWVEVEVNKVADGDCILPPAVAVRASRVAPTCADPCATACVPPLTKATGFAARLPSPRVMPAQPRMFMLRAFRKADGQLVVEPPPPCPAPCVTAPTPAHYVVDCADGNCVYRAVTAQPMHMPMPVGAPRPALSIVPCAAVTPPQRECCDSVIRAVTEDGKSCLQMETGSDCCVSFSDLTLKFPGCSPCKLTPNGERVEISTPFASAVADSVKAEMGSNFIQLEGNVKITYHAKGREGTTCADKACIHLTEGNMTIKLEVSEKASE